jgi:hypothetical protein
MRDVHVRRASPRIATEYAIVRSKSRCVVVARVKCESNVRAVQDRRVRHATKSLQRNALH